MPCEERARVRLTVLPPAFRRYVRAVVRRSGASRGAAKRVAIEVREHLERAAASGMTPAQVVASMRDPADVAAAVVLALGLPPQALHRSARLRTRVGGAVGAVVLLMLGLVGFRVGRSATPPTWRALGEVRPQGDTFGAWDLVAADLRGDGGRELVGIRSAAVVVWAVGARGDLQQVAAFPAPGIVRPGSRGPVLAVGSFVSGGGQQVAAVLPGSPAVLWIIGWSDGRAQVLARQGLSGMPLAAVGSNGDLYLLGGGPTTVTRWAWDATGSRMRTVTTATVAGVAGQVLGGGDKGLFVSAACPCRAVDTVAALLDPTDLRTLWRGSLAPFGATPLAGGAPVVQAYAAGTRFKAMLAWNGSTWRAIGALPYSAHVISPAPPGAPTGAAWLAEDTQAVRVEWLAADGGMVAATQTPFPPGMADLTVAGADLVAWGPQAIAVARWGAGGWILPWSGLDTSTLDAAALIPEGGHWDLEAASGDVYAPEGHGWVWRRRVAGFNELPPQWVEFQGRPYALAAQRTAGGGVSVSLRAPGGAVAYAGTDAGPVFGGARLAAFTVPLSGGGTDVAVYAEPVHRPTPVPGTVLIFTRSGAHALRTAAWTSVDGADGQSSAVVVGARTSLILLPSAADLWNGRHLAVAPPLPRGFVVPWDAQTMRAGGRWVTVGLDQAAPPPPMQPRAAHPIRIVVAWLGPLGRPRERVFDTGVTAAAAQLLALPDGTGRVLVSASGCTLAFAIR